MRYEVYFLALICAAFRSDDLLHITYRNHMNTKEFLKTLGYQQPYDESPIETPDGFYGGTVDHTGGNIMCRRWRTWEANEKAGDVGYEVIYDVSRSATVACEKYRYNDDAGYYEHDSTEMLKEAQYNSDYALAQVAKSIMEIMSSTALSGTTKTPSEPGPQVLRSQGHVVFDDLAEDSFRDLVAETLDTSEFIKTSTEPESGLLVINEVSDPEQ